jgi:GMP synthase (glutamine-hydrolysing)
MDIQEKVIILDFGSQYTQLIARRTRESGVYSEIHPCTITAEELKALQPSAIILSGGPASVSSPDSPGVDPVIFNWGLPVLGICYGMQLMAHVLGGKVAPSLDREYGRSELYFQGETPLWERVTENGKLTVWMSHGDHVLEVPPGFTVTAKTQNIEIAAMANVEKRMYALQFHPEVAHTEQGDEILRNFLFHVVLHGVHAAVSARADRR